jgi:hypothetical protein
VAAKRALKQNGKQKELTRAAKARLDSRHLISQSRQLRKQSELLIEAMLKETAKIRRDPQ